MLEEKNEEIKNLKTKLEETLKAKSAESHVEGPRNINELCKDRTKLKLLVKFNFFVELFAKYSAWNYF